MDKEIVIRLHGRFEEMIRRFPETDTEFWCARDLQELLGYAKWENFSKVIDKAITSCQNADYEQRYHFVGIRKMVVERWVFGFNTGYIIIFGHNSSRRVG